MSPTIQYSIVGSGENETLVVFIPGGDRPLVAASDHPNYQAILDGARANDAAIASLFDIGETVEIAFQRLTDRVTVKGGQVYVDGDPMDSTLMEQILDFVNAGADFAPLLAFYEKLETNPLGNVRQGVYDWITGQRKNGALTITEDGDIIGYKSYASRPAKLRADEADTVYVSSRPARNGDIVNDVEVPEGEYAEHLPGDVVEMPRSIVLNAPSQECGTGLHIGTFSYANGFQGDTVMTVVFNPRDIVSLPDSNATWKLRVCRYTILDIVDAPLDVPVYQVQKDDVPDETEEGDGEYADDDTAPIETTFAKGDRVTDDRDGEEGTVISEEPDEDGDILVDFDDTGELYMAPDSITKVGVKVRTDGGADFLI